MVAPAQTDSQFPAPGSGLAPAVEAAKEGAFLQLEPPPFRGVPDYLLDAGGRPFGPPLAKLTPFRHHLLLGYRSPFVTSGPARVLHLLQALYLCSPAYRGGSRLAFALYRLRHAWWAVRHFEPACLALKRWLDAPFDLKPEIPRVVSPDSPDGRPAADYHWLADGMLLGRRLGLSPVEVLHTPYAMLWPMVDATIDGARGDRPRFNKKRDRQIQDYLKGKRAQALAGKPSSPN